METEHQIERILGTWTVVHHSQAHSQHMHTRCCIQEACGFWQELSGGEKSHPQKGYFTQSDQQEGNQCQLHGHIQVYVQQWQSAGNHGLLQREAKAA